MLRLNESLEHKLVRDIDVLRTVFPGSVASSLADQGDLERRGSVSGSTSHGLVPLADGIGNSSKCVPLTKETLDLMDTPVPSGVLAEEFAYHGLAPSFLKEMHQARELLNDIYTDIKRYIPLGLPLIRRHCIERRERICREYEIASDLFHNTI